MVGTINKDVNGETFWDGSNQGSLIKELTKDHGCALKVRQANLVIKLGNQCFKFFDGLSLGS